MTIRQLDAATARVLVLSLLAATGCGQVPATKGASESAKRGVEASGERAEGEQTAPIVALMELTLTQEGRPIARLHADGHTEGTEPDSSGKPAYFVPGPTLRADGTITLKGGFAARVERDGKIYVVAPASQGGGEHLFGRISGSELKFASSDQPWVVRIEGDTLRFNGPGFPNRIEGVVNDRVRHTVLVMTAAFFLDMSLAPH